MPRACWYRRRAWLPNILARRASRGSMPRATRNVFLHSGCCGGAPAHLLAFCSAHGALRMANVCCCASRRAPSSSSYSGRACVRVLSLSRFTRPTPPRCKRPSTSLHSCMRRAAPNFVSPTRPCRFSRTPRGYSTRGPQILNGATSRVSGRTWRMLRPRQAAPNLTSRRRMSSRSCSSRRGRQATPKV